MKRAINYRDLGDFLNELRNANYSDPQVTVMLNAWKKFDKAVPEFAATEISDESTDKLIARFAEEMLGELQQTTITSYSNRLRSAVPRMLDHFEATGSLHVAAPPKENDQIEPAGDPTYGDMSTFFEAFFTQNPKVPNASRWRGTCNAVLSRVPGAFGSVIDPERTEEIVAWFESIALDVRAARAAARKATDEDESARILSMPSIARNTVKNYQFWFRNAVRTYCDTVRFPYTEVPIPVRRERMLAERRAKKDAQAKRKAEIKSQQEVAAALKEVPAAVEEVPPVAKPEAPEPGSELEAVPEPVPVQAVAVPEPVQAVAVIAAAEPPLAEVVEQAPLVEYGFLLRPGVNVSLALPDDLTPREADRVAQWVRAFVVDPEPGAL